ncbi:hypothetical protein ACPPVO_27080 [Dactylosporangium sp. McL0621]|uniref:hypothetical protein n=1 Tax=Dactylosporangium sp. McL0621 TaxID=3415678 RepID=UPI003CF6F563
MGGPLRRPRGHRRRGPLARPAPVRLLGPDRLGPHAARHGRTLRPDEPLAEPVLRSVTGRTGWRLVSYDDPPHRFHAVAVRR